MSRQHASPLLIDAAIAQYVRDQAGKRFTLGLTGGDATIDTVERPVVSDAPGVDDLENAVDRERALVWLRGRTDDFIDAPRPRGRSALCDIAEE